MTELRQSAQSFRDIAAKQLTDLTESARRFFSREERRAEEFRRNTHLLIDQLDARLDERAQQVRGTRAALVQHAALPSDDTESPVSTVDDLLEQNTHNHEHVDELRRRLAALAVKVDRLAAASSEEVPDNDL